MTRKDPVFGEEPTEADEGYEEEDANNGAEQSEQGMSEVDVRGEEESTETIDPPRDTDRPIPGGNPATTTSPSNSLQAPSQSASK